MNSVEPEESFLTVAEVADMLKLNQQTVRNWIDQGSLPALRVGRRVRIRAPTSSGTRRSTRRARVRPGGRWALAEDFWGGEPVGVADARIRGEVTEPGMSFEDDLDRQRAQIIQAVRQAGTEWAEAMRAHKLAPPDAGFATRLSGWPRRPAREQIAWEHAHAAGVIWRPVPGAENAEPPYELRPGHGPSRSGGALGALRCKRGQAEPRNHRIQRGRGRGCLW